MQQKYNVAPRLAAYMVALERLVIETTLVATIAKVILQQFHIAKGLAFHCESQSFYITGYVVI